MFLLTAGTSGGYMQLIVLLLVFVLILYASYLVTKWLAKKGVLGSRTKNIQFVESFRLSQNKQISILKIGKRYHAVGVSKDHIEYLTEIEEDDLEFCEDAPASAAPDFKEVLKNTVNGITKKNEKPK